VEEGDASLLTGRKYDVIIANINRNILIQDIPTYAQCLNPNGVLFLSGFYTEDLPMLVDRCKQFTLKFDTNIEKNNWVAAKFCNMQ
jgi:ribosomal protein L11 methyltransferase